MNYGHLISPEPNPLFDQMTQDRSLAPGQQQLGLAHALGAAGREDYRSKTKGCFNHVEVGRSRVTGSPEESLSESLAISG